MKTSLNLPYLRIKMTSKIYRKDLSSFVKKASDFNERVYQFDQYKMCIFNVYSSIKYIKAHDK